MNSKRLHVLLLFLAALPLFSCSGLGDRGIKGGGGGGGSNAHVSVSLYDTPPSGLNILSFTLPIAGISLKPSSGSAIPLTPAVSSVEATRLQTDSALLVDAASVTPGTYTLSVTVGPTTASSNVFINTGSSITYTLNGSSFTCPNNAVCFLPAGAVTTITFSGSLTLSSGEDLWIGLDLNLNNAITTSGGLSVDFTQANVLSYVTTPRSGLPAGAAETIEDFTGAVTAYTSGSSITVQNGVSGQTITAALTTGTEYDVPPVVATSYALCGNLTAQGCIKVGSTVSLSAVLSTSGTLTATEVDVLDHTSVDEVEGVIYPTSTVNVFGLILADKVSASGNAVLGASTTTYGTGILLNVASLSNFSIDTKSLSPAPIGFAATSDLLAGQRVRVQVSNVASGASGITANATNMLLRYSRLTGTATNVSGTSFDFAPPSYVTAFPPTPIAYLYNTTQYDGTTSASGVPAGSTIAIRALFLDNTQPTFAVEKVRVP